MELTQKTKRRVSVAAQIISGSSQGQVAKNEGITKQAVSKQAKTIEPIPVLDPYIIEFATELFKANIALCKQLQDPEYVKTQSASDVGVLAGVLNDKAGRAFAAIGGRGSRPAESKP